MKPELLRLFGGGVAKGEPGSGAREKKREEPPLLSPASPPPGAEKPGFPLKWTYNRFLDAAEGEVYHALLQRVEEAGPGLAAALERAREDLAALGVAADPASVKKLETFLSLPEAAEWFMARPGRTMKSEAEFVDAAGSLFRMDRVIVDPDLVTVVDFKTGGANDGNTPNSCENTLR